ncbi:polysaccharide pyruvyl transferase family protein [Pseudoalteromonas sp. SWYJZ19]|uniref:polysaccharide pyruvyl transferase family protein n=1 Tax=Pseudoalteromonas sp. SWYJZ19 TaxID=2792068 RepID=UPI0018CE6E10|nr:polysaccharide pyruvyl transferase family protein [Pseudoalteromonas sp. SWYJZ19]MBH0048908.1 polysaccharide pyruvyl transferase family protein [Pseudoalteromonas sp. SWYJZ19]
MSVKSKVLNRLGLSKVYFDKTKFNNSITVFDTSIGTMNVGDEIINDSAKKWLKYLFSNEQFINLSTHDGISNVGINRSSTSDYRFVCGSNILNSNLLTSQQWNFSPFDFLRIEPLTLMGVGWSNYQKKPSSYTKWIYNNRLEKDIIHSVRDSYSLSMLNTIGVKNVINTSCPTMWGLTESHCKKIPQEQAENVVFTLTDYRADLIKDSELIKILISNYKSVYFWIQGSRDLSYFNQLDKNLTKHVILVAPRLDAYDVILDSSESLDFVGTRLHAGIRAMQKGRRAIILGVDNRAIEKQKDFNLPVVLRENIQKELTNKIKSNFPTNVRIPEESINKWMEQFKC